MKCNVTSHLKNCENLSIKYIQQSESAMSNLFNCRVQVIVSIVRNVMPQYSMKQDFLRYNIFTSDYVCMNTQKIKGDSEEITSLPKIHTRTWWTTHITSMITKNKPHAHASPVSFAYHESHHDSYSQFPQSPLGNLGPQPSLCVLNTKEKKRPADYKSGYLCEWD